MGKKSKLDTEVKEETLDETLEERQDGSAVAAGPKVPYEDKLKYVSPMSHPMASRKLAKRLYKLVKKGRRAKSIRKGVKELKKFIRKGEKGIVVLAGDTDPIDIISHFPVACEEKGIPYCWTPSKKDLGAYMETRPCCAVMVKTHPDYQDDYDRCLTEVKGLPVPL